jgi:hypothetical protein
VNWSVSIDGTNLIVTGSGTYKVSGGTSPEQELVLDLQVGLGNVEHFDSGLVPDSAPFPEIQVTISIHGQVCFDTVFAVNASPVSVPPVSLVLASSNSVVLSWPMSSSQFILKESSDLTTTTNWNPVTNASTVAGQNKQVLLDRAPGSKFYRLEPN